MKTKQFIASTLTLFTTTALCFPLVQSTVAQAQTSSTAVVVGITKIAAGSTTPGATNWQPYVGSISINGIYVDVDTSGANFTSTPKYVTSIGGDGYHWATTGGSAIYSPTPTGFRVYVRFSDNGTLSPAFANQNRFHINWIGIGQ
ncbi:hypothetical protein LC653_41710 [Nostoc sp. CHAB 5784]|uniref:Uncharacterized protein n=1 Tax=Nostoc favosum CHAB5714 TaxID=2780399 RepID=A0ABS8I277_9NOSO|nr:MULTISPECIES: hypothetical protein [Nostoc]MCC5598299.1 hypothetical protein [Nostoc favosum CHAB5714]MCC5670140.1 hypothetical protein [Nostoc mirabile CHAB5784]